MRRFALHVACWSVSLTPLLVAQTSVPAPEADKPTTISARANLVNLPVVVRDNKGKLLQTLGKEDFALTVDGAPATIRYFDKDQNVRLTLGLLVDTSGSMRSNLDAERVASGAFLEKMLGKASPDGPDRAFVIQFGHEAEMLADLTESRPKLQAGLKEIDSSSTGGGAQGGTSPDPQDQNGSGGGGQDRGSGRHGGYGRGGSGGGGTVLYDAVYLSGDEIMSKQHGRKALIILSDGDDRGSKKTLAKAIEAAQRADTVIYAIYLKGEEHGGGGRGYGGGGDRGGGGGGRHGGGGSPGGGGGDNGGGGGYPGGGRGENQVDGKKVLQRMADETGGRLFEVKGKQTVDAIYGEIAEELRAQYRIGYTPTAETAAEGYHRLTLVLPAATYKKDVVQTRDGYYTGADTALAAK